MDVIRKTLNVVSDPEYSSTFGGLLWILDTVLTAGIIWKVPYTEIDWKAYMQQIAIYISGERNYAKIYGDTGPLVYPGGHVYIYRLLYEFTDKGTNILHAQIFFATLYLTTLYVVIRIYQEARVPPYVLPLLILSKRLHSIFVLRLFNDGFAALFFYLAIFAYQKRMWTAGSIAWSIGLGIKMSLLLALPAVGIILWQAVGRDRSFKQVALMAQIQVMLGYEFLGHDFANYLGRAFELGRQFLFKWTVNWRFVGEEAFLSKEFSIGLLVTHAMLLVAYVQTRWLRPTGISLTGIEKALLAPPPKAEQEVISRRVRPDLVAFTMLSSMLIGCLCARSLHYQFYAYIAWSTPLLLWQSGLHPVLIYVAWLAQEWAWNVYPSTDISSMVVVGSLAFTLLASWYGTRSLWIMPSEAKKTT